MSALLNWLVNYLSDVTIGIVNHAFDTPAITTTVETVDYGYNPLISDNADVIDRYSDFLK